jgi:hypothetical protein
VDSESPNEKGNQKISGTSKVLQNLTFSHPSILCIHFYFQIISDSDFVVIPDTVSYPQTTVVNTIISINLDV